MDNSIVAMEESHHVSDFEASASELGSLVQINSISIDISSNVVEEMEALRHEHFSIRGFVAGMRKKDPKTCFPFATQEIDADPIDYLPPLLVPSFRWWQCSYCVPDIAMKKGSDQEMVEAGKSDAGISSCQYIGNQIALRDDADGEREKYPGTGKEKTNIMNKEAGSSHDITNLLQITERLNTTADDEHPSGTNNKPGNDGNFSALNPRRRKPKLRSLADILVEVNNTIGHNPKALEITPSEMEPVLGPQIESDVAEASGNPPRKMKFFPEEVREPLETAIFPGEAKRTRGPTLDTERKCKRVETSDTESEGDDWDASMNLYEWTKPKTVKSVDNRKKAKQIHAENLPKCDDAPRGASFGKLGEMGAYFRSILNGQQMQNISNVTDKISEVEADGDTVVPNSKGALDLSLDSYRGIPDLNVEFNQEIEKMQEKQFSAVSEKQNSPLHKTLFFQDVSASGTKGKTGEDKNKSRLAKPPKKDSNIELGASDHDIPMEIVELLARNQHERALGTSKGPLPHFNNNTPVSYSSLHVDKHPDMINFPPAKRRNGLTVPSRNKGFEQSDISMKFHPFRKNHPDITKPDESQFRLFTSSKPAQQRKTQFPTSSSADFLWPPIREHVEPIPKSRPHKNSLQPNIMGSHLFSNQQHKGKTICDVNDSRDKRAVIKEGRILPSSKSLGSLDPYLNDTIPAMQLLSLMDSQVVPGSSFELGRKNFLDKPFSPCTHHAQINGKENHNFQGSFFPQSSHLKDFCKPHYGVYSPGESSRKAPSYFQVEGKSKANPLKRSSGLTIRPERSGLVLGFCTLNRNPAEFSIPDSRNEFTISSKDLKPRKRSVSKEKSRLVNGEGRKRERMRNDATRREG